MAKHQHIWTGQVTIWDDGKLFYAETKLDEQCRLVRCAKNASIAVTWLFDELASYGVIPSVLRE